MANKWISVDDNVLTSEEMTALSNVFCTLNPARIKLGFAHDVTYVRVRDLDVAVIVQSFGMTRPVIVYRDHVEPEWEWVATRTNPTGAREVLARAPTHGSMGQTMDALPVGTHLDGLRIERVRKGATP